MTAISDYCTMNIVLLHPFDDKYRNNKPLKWRLIHY